MCDYEVSYFDLKEGKSIFYRCPHKKWDKKTDQGKSYCIFHSDKKDKDSEVFLKNFAGILKSGTSRHIFPGFIFPKGLDLSKLKGKAGSLIFLDSVFFRAQFFCLADFSGAEFKGDGGANFIEARFFSGAVFGGASFSGDGGADFMGARFSGPNGANFRMTTFSGKGQTNFSRTLFSGKGGVDFTWAKLQARGGTDFKLSEFVCDGMVDFHFAEFSGKGVNFNGAKFSGDGEANFSLVQFTANGAADFGTAVFSGKGGANFSLAQFTGKGGVNFAGAKFSGDGGANFSLAQFTGRGRDNFSEAKFEGLGAANFSKARFFGHTGVDFMGARFSNEGGVDFMGAQFAGETKVEFSGRTFYEGVAADFRNVFFENPENVTFDDVDLSLCRFLGTDLSKVNFKDVSWKNRKYDSSIFFGRVKISDELFQEKGRIIRYLERLFYRLRIWEFILKGFLFLKPKGNSGRYRSGVSLKALYSRLISKVKIAAAKREKNHGGVYQLYNQLLFNYENSNRYHEAGDFFAGQMEMRRRQAAEKPRIRMALWFYRLFSLYGERPFFALGWLILLILISGFVNLSLGMVPENTSKVIVGLESSGKIISNPDCSAIIVLSPDNIVERGGLIKYHNFSPDVIISHDFRNDYLKALSVNLKVFTKSRVKTSYVIADSEWAPLILTIEAIIAIILLWLFLVSMNRKFKRSD